MRHDCDAVVSRVDISASYKFDIGCDSELVHYMNCLHDLSTLSLPTLLLVELRYPLGARCYVIPTLLRNTMATRSYHW